MNKIRNSPKLKSLLFTMFSFTIFHYENNMKNKRILLSQTYSWNKGEIKLFLF